MIIKGSQRGGAKQLAAHLLNVLDNDHVELHELRGFVADTLKGALLESYAISKGTNADQHLFSVSFNPPPGKEVPIEQFEDAFARVEAKYGLDRHARAVVFHEKCGRRHAHAVWSRIDCDNMTAVNLPFFKRELREISRELFIEHRWKMPKGLMNSKARVSNEFTLAEWHQAKQTNLNPNDLKSMFAECWAVSDSRQSFEAALSERGYYLAQGNRRSFVAVDLTGKVYSLSRMTGVQTPELEDKLGDPTNLPDLDQKRAAIEKRYQELAVQNLDAAEQQHKILRSDLQEKKSAMRQRHRRERNALDQAHRVRLLEERSDRQTTLSKGLRRLWETFSGKRAELFREHKREDENSIRRDLKERQALVRRQLEESARLQIYVRNARQSLSDRIASALALSAKELKHDSKLVRDVRERPELILSMLTEKHSVFTRAAIQRELDAYITDRDENRLAMAQVMNSRQLVELQPSQTVSTSKSQYSTREMIALESVMVSSSLEMQRNKSFGISNRNVRRAIKSESKSLQSSAGVSLSQEQKSAVEYVTGAEQICCVIGVAGAGKSTMLSAARQAWEHDGHRVLGASLAGRAAKGLETSSGIASRTLASYELSWDSDRNRLQKGDVLVIDEAGMLGSKQLARFIQEAQNQGAKLVLVGDAEQLQPIAAGGAFRSVTEKTGCAVLNDVHRQRHQWQRDASASFAKGETETALNAYRKHGAIELHDEQADAVRRLASDYMEDLLSTRDQTSRLALAHRRVDVKAINSTIREMRKAHGELENGHAYTTANGQREFAPGDRIVFTQNDHTLDVKNGMLGNVTRCENSKLIVALDDAPEGNRHSVSVDVRSYDSFDHGYATTIHKSQGTTVDRSFVLASRTMDRHLCYVAMTRHRDQTTLYADSAEFSSFASLQMTMGRERSKRTTIDFEHSPSQSFDLSPKQVLQY